MLSDNKVIYLKGKKRVNKLFLLVILITSVSYGATSKVAKKEEGFSLTIKVDRLRNSKGVVQFSLYNKEGTIPDKKYTQYYRQLTTNIRGSTATVTFKKLPAGRYAVSILHDENKNKRVDKGFILPIEGVGFTNYQSIGMRNKPSFSRASFYLQSNVSKAVNVIYF